MPTWGDRRHAHRIPTAAWRAVALRFEARGYATLVDSDSALFCSGGCVVSIKGDTVTQGDILLGLTFRY